MNIKPRAGQGVSSKLSRRTEAALQTARRKEIYETLHPGAKHGGDRKSDQVANLATRSFAEDQADKTGTALRTVRLNAQRGEALGEDLEAIAGT